MPKSRTIDLLECLQLSQHANMMGKSVATALHKAVKEAEKAIIINILLLKLFWILKGSSIMSRGESPTCLSKNYGLFVYQKR
uniref:Uncharacterized protein n=1 Tax=Megaselia scalaris TaxID=36166 RepID=T1H3W6_MEGSC